MLFHLPIFPSSFASNECQMFKISTPTAELRAERGSAGVLHVPAGGGGPSSRCSRCSQARQPTDGGAGRRGGLRRGQRTQAGTLQLLQDLGPGAGRGPVGLTQVSEPSSQNGRLTHRTPSQAPVWFPALKEQLISVYQSSVGVAGAAAAGRGRRLVGVV